MTDATSAEQLNEKGLRLAEVGDASGAAAAYIAAIECDPTWSAPVYNLGLLYKYRGEWELSRKYNKRATELSPEDEASWWNLGIAATALCDWDQARAAWHACGMTPPTGSGAPDFNWGRTPVRLEPDGDAEVVWARRIDPARAEILNVPLPSSRFRWRDIVLTDGAEEGQRIVDGRTYPVFNVLQLLSPSDFCTFVVELGTEDDTAIDLLETLASEVEINAEYWGTSTRILCRACSLGLPDEHTGHDSNPAHPHLGLATRDRAAIEPLIERWLTACRTADLVRYYEVPRSA